jgi:hypothetical protein
MKITLLFFTFLTQVFYSFTQKQVSGVVKAIQALHYRGNIVKAQNGVFEQMGLQNQRIKEGTM